MQSTKDQEALKMVFWCVLGVFDKARFMYQVPIYEYRTRARYTCKSQSKVS